MNNIIKGWEARGMLKVLIVDDEIKVCRLIEYLIDWNALGLEIVGTAHDGQTACELIREKKPDIVVTDIRMPVCDGLELIQKVKESDRNISFIIISGYSDFSYAQKAIKYGVDDYLLKPLKKKELLQTLNKLIVKHHAIEEDNIEKEAMIRQIRSNEKKMKVNLLSEIIDRSDLLKGDPLISTINKEYCCNFGEGYYQMILLQPILNFPDTDDRVYDFVTTKLKDVINSELSSFNEIITLVKEEYVYCLVNGTDEQFSRLKKQLKKIKTFILGFKDVIGEVKIHIALSSEKTRFSDVSQCVGEVKYAMLNKLVLNTEFLEYASIPKDDRRLEEIIDTKFRKDFLFNMETLNLAEQDKLLEKLKTVLKSSSISGQLILKVYLELIDLLGHGIKTNNIAVKDESFQNSLLRDFYRFGSVDEVFGNLQQKLNQGFNEWKNERKMEYTKPIRVAKQYIHDHYNQPLTLELIGDQIGLNPAYFSSVFKKETGENFVDYLTEVRISNAKRLLIETEKSIADISEEVGFNDIKYFTKKFKKLTFLSPSEYRKLYS
jgi:two-component system response regulator YesN